MVNLQKNIISSCLFGTWVLWMTNGIYLNARSQLDNNINIRYKHLVILEFWYLKGNVLNWAVIKCYKCNGLLQRPTSLWHESRSVLPKPNIVSVWTCALVHTVRHILCALMHIRTNTSANTHINMNALIFAGAHNYAREIEHARVYTHERDILSRWSYKHVRLYKISQYGCIRWTPRNLNLI